MARVCRTGRRSNQDRFDSLLNRLLIVFPFSGGVPIAQFTADWIMPKGSPTSGKLRIVGFQLCAPSVVNNFWDRILSAAPYAATAFLCLMWMLKSRLCEDQNDNRAQSRYQQALSER